MGNNKSTFNWNKIRILVESAAMIALAFVLSMVKIYKLPWGGSVTLLSMLPIVILSIRNGVKNGLICAFLYSLTQFLDGVVGDGLFAWGLSPLNLSLCIFLDYIGAFTVLGLAGMFRKSEMKGWISGTVIVIALRYAMHVVSGAVVFHSTGMLWESLGEIANPWLYSAGYNACYMLPEMILTTVGAVALFKTGAIKMILKTADVNA